MRILVAKPVKEMAQPSTYHAFSSFTFGSVSIGKEKSVSIAQPSFNYPMQVWRRAWKRGDRTHTY